VPDGTVRAAKTLLAGNGLIIKSAGRFYTAGPRPSPAETALGAQPTHD
jgi:hypothetical protein